MRKALAAVALTAVIATGSILVAAANPMGLATAATQPSPPSSTKSGPHVRDHEGAGLQAALDALVKDGTLTQAQADAVMSKVKELAPKFHERDGRRGRFGDHLKTVADAIGITVDQLLQEMRSGKTIAEVAKDHGVPPQKVIDTLVKDANARIDQAVKDGHLDAGRAASIKKDLPAQITKVVNGELPRMRGMWGRDHGGTDHPGAPPAGSGHH